MLLGDKILAANHSMAIPESEIHLRPGEKFVETPRREGFGWDDSIGNYLKAAKGEAGVIRFLIRATS